jgi:alkaline phosphatase D
LALGSCFFVNDSLYDRPGKSYGGNYEILQSIYDKKPDLMLWLGDNTYLREPDYFTVSGMLYRYTHTRSLKELQPLLASCAHYAIWDDHDYGPNDSDRSFKFKNTSQQIFENFWANPKPVHTKSYYTSFTYEDCEFFLLDNRYFRTPNKRTTDKRTILGEEQFQWLIDGLVASKANFKFVCIGGQVLNTAAVFENYAIFEDERKYIIETIQKENIKNVIFLTGDRHHSELTVTPNEPKIYDFTISPLTAGAANFPDEKNEWRVKDSYIGVRNFGLITVSGKLKERVLNLQILDSNGKELWKYTINLQK